MEPVPQRTTLVAPNHLELEHPPLEIIIDSMDGSKSKQNKNEVTSNACIWLSINSSKYVSITQHALLEKL